MKTLFDDLSRRSSKMVTKAYSTSFSIGISFLAKRFQNPIYAIYGFVRFADEIVDTFHQYDKRKLLNDFRLDTFKAIDQKISLNPILNNFQQAVHEYQITWDLIDTFLKSMEMDLDDRVYDREEYEKYILGSAEVVGLMCLKVFVEGDDAQYNRLKPYAMKLGSAFQKINFLRDLRADQQGLGRIYFPELSNRVFDEQTKKQIEEDLVKDFKMGYEGIKMLPRNARFGVYVAYKYYANLLSKIKKMPPQKIMHERVRIPDNEKYALFFGSYLRHSLNLL
jgi:phytoene/squalene synthetase